MLKVRMYNAQGVSFGRTSLCSLYATDMRHTPYVRKLEVLRGGEVLFEMPKGPVMINARLDVPGFGHTWVIADNCGKGYTDGGEIEFVREAAISRVHEVETELKKGGFKPSIRCLSLFNDAKTLISKAEGSSTIHDYYMTALSCGLWAGEYVALERARARINGKREGFLFGCGAFDYPYAEKPGLKEMFESLFNYSTLPFYLDKIEHEKGKTTYEQNDRLLEAFTKANIICKAHPLWWGFKEAGTPPWAKSLKWDDGSMPREIERVAKRSVSLYKGRIKYFDAINEAHDWSNAYQLTQDQEVEATRISCDAVHEANPDAVAIVNVCLPFGDYVPDGATLYGPNYDPILTPLTYFEKVNASGVNYDVVGIQLYNPGRDMLAIDKLFDRLVAIGKPIHFTELGVPSRYEQEYEKFMGYNVWGLWHEFGWNERLQADWMEEFYTLAYARPEVEAITWWNIADPSFIPASGFYNEDGKPKEMCFRLKALEESWGYNFPEK